MSGAEDPLLLAFADDMTGALEVGAKFARAGAVVTASVKGARCGGAVIFDTETRHANESDAFARVRAFCRQTSGLVYKKTDSTLRGNIGSEVAALAAAYPERPIVFAPAYPAMGRTVLAGHVYVHGKPLDETPFAYDALNPVGSSYVPDVLSGCGLPIVLHADVRCDIGPGAVHVFDAETEDDVAAVTAFADRNPIFCGTGSLAGHLSRHLNIEPASIRLRGGRCLVINGSLHPRSNEQVLHAKALGWPTATADQILADGMPGPWAILDCTHTITGPRVRDIVRAGFCDTLVIFGGDTAYAVIEAMGVSELSCAGELLPGIPVSAAAGVTIISKAGGFGTVDVLARMRERMSEGV